MRQTMMQGMCFGALVWSISVALVSGRVAGVMQARILKSDDEERLLAPVPSTSDGNETTSVTKAILWVNVLLIVVGIALTVSFALLVLMIRRGRHKHRAVLLPQDSWPKTGSRPPSFVSTCPVLTRKELEVACEDFSNIIGTSSDGLLYKGTLLNGTEVAVTSIRTSSSDWSSDSELSFRRKIEGLSRMKHKHLVNLVGYCTDEDPFTRMLVFEYACNGTLSDHLQNPKEMEHLDWATRMRIIMGAAYGLEYMHHKLNPPCSHLNFDATAVYLTDAYSAKIANFGIARMAPEKRLDHKPSWLGNGRVSSAGYADDEWDGNENHTPGFESNLYHFGVFLLQTISGRPSYDVVDWASDFLCEPTLAPRLVDPELKAHNAEELLALCKIVNLCLSSKSYQRPSMRKVSQVLAEELKMTPEAAAMKASPLLWAQQCLIDDSA